MLDWHSLEWVWPRLLWLQLLIPVCCLLPSIWRQFKRSNFKNYQEPIPASKTWYAAAAVSTSKWRRFWMTALLVLGIAAMLLSLARPKAVVMLPTRLDGVMLAIDSSGSMRAKDVKPSRIEVAQAIANQLVDTLPSQVKMGVVSMAGTASLIQAPTEDRDDLRKAIEALSLQPGSAVGSGLIIALDAVLPASGVDVKKIIEEGEGARGTQQRPEPMSLDEKNGLGVAKPAAPASSAIASTTRTIHKLEPGSNKATAVVLITDGQGNLGPDPIKMAQIAADLGVRVYTIGVGTTQGEILKAKGMSMRVKLDEDVLKKIADMTAGEYFKANDAPALQKIYQQLSFKIALQKHRQMEVTAWFALFGMVLLLLSALLRFRQMGRVI